jgi:hypothetical protein
MIDGMIDAEEYNFLTFVKKGVTSEQIRDKYGRHEGGEFIRWSNAHFYVDQHATSKRYMLSFKGKQAMQFREKYGE